METNQMISSSGLHLHMMHMVDSTLKMNIKQYAYEVGYLRFNWHDTIEIMTVLNGSLLAFADGKATQLECDDVFIINSNVGHTTMLIEPNTISMVLHIHPDIFYNWTKGKKRIVFNCCSDSTTRYNDIFNAIRKDIATIYTELVRSTPESPMFVRGAVLNLCASLIRAFPPTITNNSVSKANVRQKKRVKQILSYTEKHFQDKISLDDLANMVDMNRTYLSTFFKSYVGISYYEYLTRKRLSHAVYMLNNAQHPLIDVAIDSGFSDAKALNSAFKKYFGISPDKYRKQLNHHIYSHAESKTPRILEPSHPYVNSKILEYLGI